MKTSADRLHFEGTRAEILAELRRLEEGWRHLGKPSNAAEARRGVADVEAGNSSVQVGHARYDVTES